MVRDPALINKIRTQLHSAENILVVTHVRPDGDAIGSLLGIGLPLIKLGKHVQMVLSEGMPESFLFLQGSELVRQKAVGEIDYTIVVDSAELERTDPVIIHYGKPSLNIDHHITNTRFAEVNLVEDTAVATAELISEYIPGFGLEITQAVADALITGIVTDTIGFRTTNVSPAVLQLVADLMDLGGDLPGIYYKTIVELSLPAARYWGAGLSKIQLEDGLVWTTLTLKERQESGYPDRDDADLVKIISAIEGARVAVILTEQPSGYVKISWRLCGSSPTNLNVAEMALLFGGGGHKAAAGADVQGNMDQVLEDVITTTRSYMEKSILESR